MSTQSYYSQFGEDKILNKIFKSKTGVCVEVGGFDGITGSNSYFFELQGWKCLIVEPMPKFCQAILKNRNCLLVEKAASEQEGETNFYIATGVETLSTIETNPEHLSRIKSLSSEAIEKITVNTSRLDKILIENEIRDIDFLTLDVEGHELSVLKGLSFSDVSIRIIIIEDNFNGLDPRVELILNESGYIKFKRTGCNDWYAQKGDSLLTPFSVYSTKVQMQGIKLKRKTKLLLQHLKLIP